MTSTQWHELTEVEKKYWKAELAEAERGIRVLEKDIHSSRYTIQAILEQQFKDAGEAGNLDQVEATLKLIEEEVTWESRLDQHRTDLKNRIRWIRIKLNGGWGILPEIDSY